VHDGAATGVNSCPSGAPPTTAEPVLRAMAVYPRPQRIAWSVCALVVVGLVGWSFGTAEVVGTPSERTAVNELPTPLSAPEAGVIARVLSKEGDQVLAGQVLVELTVLDASADARARLGNAAMEERITTALIAALRSGRPPVLSRESPAQERALFQADWRDITIQLARFDTAVEKWQAEQAALRRAMAEIEASLPEAELRASDFERLVDDATLVADVRRERVRQRIEQERKLSAQQALLKSARATETRIENERSEFVQRSLLRLSERQTPAAAQRMQLTRSLGKSERPARLIQLTAPVTGTVRQLAVPAKGGVALPGQVLLGIVPEAGAAELILANER
jgi:hemolysin D